MICALTSGRSTIGSVGAMAIFRQQLESVDRFAGRNATMPPSRLSFISLARKMSHATLEASDPMRPSSPFLRPENAGLNADPRPNRVNIKDP
jgi:hypothetical protein